MKASRHAQISLWLDRVLGTLCLGAGLLTIFSWLSETITLLQFLPGLRSMHFISALVFAITGSYLLINTYVKHEGFKNIFQWLVILTSMLVGLLTLINYAAGFDFHLVNWFLTHSFIPTPSYAEQLAINTAVCMLAISLYFYCQEPSKSEKYYLMPLALAVLFGLGITSLFGYFSGIRFAYHWKGSQQMALSSALLFTLFGLFAGIKEFVREYSSPRMNRLSSPLIAALLVMGANIGIWQALRSDVQFRLDKMLSLSTQEVAVRFGSAFNNILNDFQFKLPILSREPSLAERQRDLQRYLSSTHFISGIMAFSPEGKLLWQVLEDDKNQQLFLSYQNIIRQQLISENPPIHADVNEELARLSVIPNRNLFYMLINQAYSSEQNQEVIALIIRAAPLIESLAHRFEIQGYQFSLALPGLDLYQSKDFQTASNRFTHRESFALLNLMASIEARLSPQFITRMHSFMPEVILVTGVILAILAYFTARLLLVQAAREFLLNEEVSRRREVEQQLRQEKQRADAANHSKSEFLANMSHEIRTPLHAIIGYADLLKADVISQEERSKALEAIKRNGSLLNNLVDSVLDISKIEARKLSLEILAVDLLEISRDLYSLFAGKAESKGIKFSLGQDGVLPRYIMTDSMRFCQILMNLIANAIKFTKVGGVTVTFRANTSNNTLEVDVQDSGIGIPVAMRESIFEEFRQAEISITRRFGGTGLGLSLARELAHALGGDVICVKSEVDVGSCFRASIPLTVAGDAVIEDLAINIINETVEAANEDLRLEGASILVIDDAIDSQTIIAKFLESAGCTVSIATTAKEALEVLQRQNFDVVLLDIELPDMSGYQVLAKARENSYSGAMVALTAHAMDETRNECLKAGFDEYIAKPVTRSSLLASLSQLAIFARTQSESSSSIYADDAIIGPLLPLFLQSMPQRLELMDVALYSQDWPKFFGIVHQIKGTAAAYGFRAIGGLAGKIEELNSQPIDLEKMRTLTKELRKFFEKSCAEHGIHIDHAGLS